MKSGVSDHVWREKVISTCGLKRKYSTRKVRWKESAHMLGVEDLLSNPSLRINMIWSRKRDINDSKSPKTAAAAAIRDKILSVQCRTIERKGETSTQLADSILRPDNRYALSNIHALNIISIFVCFNVTYFSC